MAKAQGNSNVLSFNEIVKNLQQLNNTAKAQEKNSKTMADLEKAVVVLDAMGEKILAKEEKFVEATNKTLDETKKQNLEYNKKSLAALNDINKTLAGISKTIGVSITGGKFTGGTGKPTLTGITGGKGAKLTEADEKQHFLLNKVVSGLSGLKDLKDVTDKGLTNVIKATNEGAKKKDGMFDKIKGGISGIGDLIKTGKIREGSTGRFRNEKGRFISDAMAEKGGLSGKYSAVKDAFQAGRAAEGGGIGRGLGQAFATMSPGGAGMVGRGLTSMMNVGPVAGAAAIGLAGFNAVNDVLGNIDKSNEIEENVKSGALSRSEGNVLQGESLGDTAGTTAGALIGGTLGSALGPLGTAAGAWLGSKAGGWLGGKVGKYGVKAYQGVKSMLGFGETKEEEQAKMSPEQKLMNQFSNGEIDAEEYNKRMKLQEEGGAAPPAPTPVTAEATKTPIEASPIVAAVPAEVTAEKTPSEPTPGFGERMKTWFSGTKVGQAWADRNVSVGEERGDRGTAEELIGTRSSLETYSNNEGSARVMSEGVTSERSALGSSWLGRLIAGKGTETENFLATGERSSENYATGESKTDLTQSFGRRISGGFFGKDKYMIGEDEVDKDTYLQSKKIAAEGGDAFKIDENVAEYKRRKEREEQLRNESVSSYDAMGNYTGEGAATPSVEATKESGPGFFSGIGDKIKGWFGGTKLGQAIADRNKDVSDFSGPRGSAEALVGGSERLEEGEANGVGYTNLNKGVTSEKSAFGSSWLGRLLAGKGTETEQFLAEGSKTSYNEKGESNTEYASTMGKRISGGWFGKDKYMVGEDEVDKETYMKAKAQTGEGGDALKIGSIVQDYKDRQNAAAQMQTEVNQMGDVIHTGSVAAQDARDNLSSSGGSAVVNAPTVVNNTTNSSNTMRSPIKNEESSVNRFFRSRYAAY